MVEIDSPYDLWFDPNGVGGDMVVETWISHGPHVGDRAFDPQPGDIVLAGDEDERPIKARVVRRDGDRVWLQLQLPRSAHPVS